MRSTTLILMTVLALAVLDGGNVKSGFTQSAVDLDYCLGIEISGASGRSVCENNWTASWTWTAPTTGAVTFDIESSDFDMHLVVSVGSTRVTSNRDLDGTLQGEVRFNAQQGREYRISAWRTDDSIDPGTIVLNWQESSYCDDDTKPVLAVPSGLRERVFDNPRPGAPAYVLAGPDASIWYWSSENAVTESLYASKDGSTSVRTFYDADGLPRKVLDECSGSWMLIRRYNSQNVDFWFYHEDGTFQSGFAVYEGKDGQHYYAEIDGVPVHAGKQFTGFLQPTGSSWTGSYTLKVDMSVVKNAQPVPQDIAALIDGLSSNGAGRTGMITGWRARLARTLRPVGIWLSPSTAIAQGRGTFKDVLGATGFFMLAGGIAELLPEVYRTAGAFTAIAAQLAPDIAKYIRLRCPDEPDMAHELCHLAADHLAHPSKRGPIGFVHDVMEWASNKAKGIRDKIAEVKQVLSHIAEILSGIAQGAAPSELPQRRDEPHPSPSHEASETEELRGIMKREGQNPVYVRGTVTPDGDLNVEDDYGFGRIELSIGATGNAPIKGSFELDGDTGEVGGNQVGHPTLVRSIPDWEAKVGDAKTIDLSQYFESANDSRLTYGDTGNEHPAVATVSLSGSTITLHAHQVGTTHINVTAWHFLDGTSTTDTMRINITSPATAVFRLTDACDDGEKIHYRLFQVDSSGSRIARWPREQGYYYVIRSYGVEGFNRVPCPAGQHVCYGAESANGKESWGVGLDGTKGCKDCCRSCPDSDGEANFRKSLPCAVPDQPPSVDLTPPPNASKDHLAGKAHMICPLSVPLSNETCRDPTWTTSTKGWSPFCLYDDTSCTRFNQAPIRCYDSPHEFYPACLGNASALRRACSDFKWNGQQVGTCVGCITNPDPHCDTQAECTYCNGTWTP